MNVGYLIERLENFQLSEEVFYLLGERLALTQVEMAVIITALVMGFLWCFFGLHGIRIWSAILGLSIGYLVFSGVASLFLRDDLIVLIIAVVLGLVLAVLNARFYLFGAFFYTFVVTAGLTFFWLNPQTAMLLAVCAIIALLAAVLVLKQPNIIVILISAVAGGVVFMIHLQQFVYLSDLLSLVFTLLLIIIGALIQFVLLSGREKRKQLARAAEIRLQKAIASEVEKARNFLDELDDRGKEKKTPKSVKEEKPKAKVAPKQAEKTEPTEQTEQEIVQRLKDEMAQKLGEEPKEVSSSVFATELEKELEIKSDLLYELEKELAAKAELKRELEKALEVKSEVALEQKFGSEIERITEDVIDTDSTGGLEKEAEKIDIAKGIPEEDFAGVLDLGRIERPVDEKGFSELDEVGEIEL